MDLRTPARRQPGFPPLVFKLVTTMRRGSSSGMPQAWAHYATVELARAGGVELLREDRVLRVMIVRNEIPQAFVEWMDR